MADDGPQWGSDTGGSEGAGMMGGLGGALGALGIGAAGSLLTGGISSAFAGNQRNEAYKLWRKQIKKGPSFQMEGLRRAGLNPILVAGAKGLSPGNVPMTMAQISTAPATTAREASLLGTEKSLLAAQTKATQAAGLASQATAARQVADANNIHEKTRQEKIMADALSRIAADPALMDTFFKQKHLGGWYGTALELFNRAKGSINNLFGER